MMGWFDEGEETELPYKSPLKYPELARRSGPQNYPSGLARGQIKSKMSPPSDLN
jgi:hypothetical protein